MYLSGTPVRRPQMFGGGLVSGSEPMYPPGLAKSCSSASMFPALIPPPLQVCRGVSNLDALVLRPRRRRALWLQQHAAAHRPWPAAGECLGDPSAPANQQAGTHTRRMAVTPNDTLDSLGGRPPEDMRLRSWGCVSLCALGAAIVLGSWAFLTFVHGAYPMAFHGVLCGFVASVSVALAAPFLVLPYWVRFSLGCVLRRVQKEW